MEYPLFIMGFFTFIFSYICTQARHYSFVQHFILHSIFYLGFYIDSNYSYIFVLFYFDFVFFFRSIDGKDISVVFWYTSLVGIFFVSEIYLVVPESYSQCS